MPLQAEGLPHHLEKPLVWVEHVAASTIAREISDLLAGERIHSPPTLPLKARELVNLIFSKVTHLDSRRIDIFVLIGHAIVQGFGSVDL
jgi:hypothetical protein